jgi:hypothetical protein
LGSRVSGAGNFGCKELQRKSSEGRNGAGNFEARSLKQGVYEFGTQVDTL